MNIICEEGVNALTAEILSFKEVRGNGKHCEEAGEWSDVQADERD